MNKRVITLLSLLIVVGMLFVPCGTTATEAPAAKIRSAQIAILAALMTNPSTPLPGKASKTLSFQLGILGKYLESKEVADYEKNLNAFVEEKCDLTIGDRRLLNW